MWVSEGAPADGSSADEISTATHVQANPEGVMS